MLLFEYISQPEFPASAMLRERKPPVETFDKFVAVNMVPLTFAYGLVYFSAGLAVLMQRRQLSSFRLAHSLWLLGAFGIIHGASEWGDIFIPIQDELLSGRWISVLTAMRDITRAASYGFLLQFGVSMITPRLPWIPNVRRFLYWYAPLWSIAVTIIGVFILGDDLGEVWIRSLLGLPGAVLTAIAFLFERRSFDMLHSPKVRSNLTLVATAFVIYAFLAGLVTPNDTLPPFAWFNYEAVHSVTRLPIQFWRMVMGFVIALFVIRTLSVFDLEYRQRLESAEREKTLYEDRQRIARDLHDGVVQSLYAAGLHLELVARNSGSATATDTADAIRHIVRQHHHLITDIRNFIFQLGPARSGEVNLEDYLKKLASTFFVNESISFNVSSMGAPQGLTPGQKQNIIMIAHECLSNAVKHAHASSVELRLLYEDDALCFSVEDNGIGIAAGALNREASHDGGTGLNGIAERAVTIGAELDIKSGPGHGGTNVSLRIPYRASGEMP